MEDTMCAAFHMPGTWTSSDTEDEWINADAQVSNTVALDKSGPPTPNGTGLPVNFHSIGPGLFRSSYPLMNHLPAFEPFHFKTIITLVAGEVPPENKAFMEKHDITHYQIPVLANKDPSIYTPDEVISRIIKIMMNRENHPILLHCNKGKHRTGCVVAIFRRCTGWPLDACITEYERYAAPKARDLDEAFIARFDVGELKALALHRGFVNGEFARPYAAAESSNASAYTNNTMGSYESTSTMNVG